MTVKIGREQKIKQCIDKKHLPLILRVTFIFLSELKAFFGLVLRED